MITITTITSIAYYQVKENRVGEDRQDLGLGYYEERGGSLGTLLRLAGPETTDGHRERGPFRSFRDGDAASFAIVERLGQGKDLETDKVVIRPVATVRGRRGRWKTDLETPTHVVAYDLTFSPEKAYSILALLADAKTRDRMLTIHDEAVEATLRLMARQGFILNRRGAQGRIRKPAAESCVAVYRHLTNRDKHPHLHSHAVLFNLCLRDDGRVGAIENKDLLTFKNACSALYRAELVHRMKARLSIETELAKDGPGITIPGFPIEVSRLFSQRRADVVADLAAKGLDSAHHREASNYAAKATRDRKDVSTPLTQLQQSWHDELAEAGFDIGAIWTSVKAGSARLSKTLGSATSLDLQEQHVARSHDAYADINLIVTRADILRIEAQARQTRSTADEILQTAQAKETDFVALPRYSHEPQRFMVAQAIRDEHALLQTAVATRERWAPPSEALIASILSGSTASPEQREAVRHMLNRDGVTIAEGAAGTGKTYVLKLLRQILTADQRKVLIAAPAWKAARLAGQEAQVSLADAQALAPLVTAIETGQEAIDHRTVIVVDEAGMAGCRDIQILVEAAARAGSKVILTGDTRQLQPVARGAPMRALIDLLGSHRLDHIRRQISSWMRDASEAFASGDTVAGLDHYHDAGEIAVHRDRSTTLAACVASFLDADTWTNPDWTTKTLAHRLLITARNEDVQALNHVVREALIAEGHLGQESIRFEAIGRGSKMLSSPVELRAGDRIMFGRRLRLRAAEVFNSDVATVLSVHDDGRDPQLTFELDRVDDHGRPIVLSGRVSELAVKDAKSPGSAIHLQHAYACTNHAAQGQTVDIAIVANLSAMGSSDIYVACTRHRVSLRIHVDASRILRNGFRTAGISRHGSFRAATESGDLESPTLSQKQIDRVIDKLRREANSRPLKANPSDFVDDVLAWTQAPDPIVAFRQRMQARTDAQIRSRTSRVAKSKPSRDQIRLTPIDQPKPDRRLARTPLSLSNAEWAHLDGLPLVETCARWFGGRMIGTSILAHRGSGFAIDVRTSRPPWSRRAGQKLRRVGAVTEHRLIQAAVLFLSKTLREARNVVRDKAGLWALNPIARAARNVARTAWRRRNSELAMMSTPAVSPADEIVTDISTGVKRQKAFLMQRHQQQKAPAVSILSSANWKGMGIGRDPDGTLAIERAAEIRVREAERLSTISLTETGPLGSGRTNDISAHVSTGVKRRKASLAQVAKLRLNDRLSFERNSRHVHAADGLVEEEQAQQHIGAQSAERERKPIGSSKTKTNVSTPFDPSPAFAISSIAIDDEDAYSAGVRRRKRAIPRQALLEALRSDAFAVNPDVPREAIDDRKPNVASLRQEQTARHTEDGVGPPQSMPTRLDKPVKKIATSPTVTTGMLSPLPQQAARLKPLDPSKISPNPISAAQLGSASTSGSSRGTVAIAATPVTPKNNPETGQDASDQRPGLIARIRSIFQKEAVAPSLAQPSDPKRQNNPPPIDVVVEPVATDPARSRPRGTRIFDVPGLNVDDIVPRERTGADVLKQDPVRTTDGKSGPIGNPLSRSTVVSPGQAAAGRPQAPPRNRKDEPEI